MKKQKILYFLSFCLLRGVLFPFRWLPYRALHSFGYFIGKALYHLIPSYKKRSLSNLLLAKDLHLSDKEAIKIAKESIGSLLITTLEYSKLSKERNIHRVATCENPEVADAILSKGKGLIFFCGHQANWELFFLEGTSRMEGVAIGQAIKNTYLYNWVLKVREKFGGKIVLPNGAIKEGLRALKKGKFLGIVGDQGMPETGFSSPFLGREAFTSPLPALLAYKCQVPIITATMKRANGKYLIRYSDPIYPDQEKSMDEEVQRMMKKALGYLEKSIKETPGQWLWQHNRWKQQLLGKLKKKYRQDAIAIFLPKEKEAFVSLVKELAIFRELYPTEVLYLFTPHSLTFSSFQVVPYKEEKELLDYKFLFKLVFNFTGNSKLSPLFLKGSAIEVADLTSLRKESQKNTSFKDTLTGAICHAS